MTDLNAAHSIDPQMTSSSLFTGTTVVFLAFVGIVLLLLGLSVGGMSVAGFALWMNSDTAPEPSLPPPIVQSTIAIEKIQDLNEVVSTRVVTTDVLSVDGNGYEGLWRVRGDALLSCDMSRAEVVTQDPDAKTATIRLPPITVLSPRVDHTATKNWSFKRKSWMPFTTGSQAEVHEAVMYSAQRFIERAAGSKENREMAAAKVESIVRGSYAMLGWNVAVVWDEDQIVKASGNSGQAALSGG